MKFIRSPSVCSVYSVVHPSPSFSPFCDSSFPSSSNPLNLNPSVVAKIHQQAQLHTGRFEILTTEHTEYTEMKFFSVVPFRVFCVFRGSSLPSCCITGPHRPKSLHGPACRNQRKHLALRCLSKGVERHGHQARTQGWPDRRDGGWFASAQCHCFHYSR